MNIEKVIGYEALWESMLKCKNGVLWKDSVANYYLDSIRQTIKLSEQLHDGTYKERTHKYFTINYPKERKIMSISFRDRVYQRSLNDVSIYPQISNSFIYDNTACQKNKGADFARSRLKCHLQRFFRKHGADGYALKIDIRGYYPNMRHDVVKNLFRKHLDSETYRRAAEILDGFPGEVGFNPGSQIIQIAGISVLSEIDHYIKERLRVKHYLRYMDDMLIISDNPTELESIRKTIGLKLSEIGFEMHPTKTAIINLRQGIMFLGFRYYLTNSGKVIMIVDPIRVKAARKKYRRLVNKAKTANTSRKKIDESYQSWRSHILRGNSWKLLQRMDRFYFDLWREQNG